ncbi:MAG: hypothetical protein ACR2PY_05330 [Salinispira sp.]
MRFLSLCIVLFSLGTGGISSEDLEWIEVNAPQIAESELVWLDVITRTGEAYQYEAAIRFIEQRIQDQRTSSADPATIGVLRRITLHPHIISGHENTAPLMIHRQRAVELLGILGGKQSLEALDEALLREREIPLLKSIFIAYENIAPPLNSLRAQYFTKHLRRAHLFATDDALALIILEAIEKIHERTSSMTDGPLFTEILSLSNSARSMRNRQAALSLSRFIVGIE